MHCIANYQKLLRHKSLSVLALVLIVCAALIVYSKTSRGTKNPYSLAEDFPRGPLVYGQFQDLPALVKQWDGSHLKQQYLSSTNYHQFTHRHLALKLIARWEEFNSALGFQLDPGTMIGAADAGAALAIYDIGRLDIVFIAQITEEKIAATKFFSGKDQFEETILPDGTTYYQHEVEADRGRQKQTLAFAAVKGRFILATNEQLLLRAIANINARRRKDSLADDPSFKTLTAAMNPHFATVWVDQAKLNDDYYFKHYWLMRNVGQLKKIRAGIFDLEQQEGRWIERREFLTPAKDSRKTGRVSSDELMRLEAMIPNDVPYFKLQALGNDSSMMTTLIRDTLLDRLDQSSTRHDRSWSWRSYDDFDFGVTDEEEEEASYDHYSSLGSNYDSTIDDPHDARVSAQEEPGENPLTADVNNQFRANLQQAIGPAHPLAAAIATSPHTVAGPFFVEFHRATILTLQTPANLRREVLEDAISTAAQSRVTIAGPRAGLKWASHDDDGQSWRELAMPMLGWQVCYALRGRELILANNSELLKAVLVTNNKQFATAAPSSVDSLISIRLDQRKEAFDDIVGRIDAEWIKSHQKGSNESSESQEFFSGDIGSLLDVASSVARIEIRRSSQPGRLHEELDFVFR
jgi:hypothetical protein